MVKDVNNCVHCGLPCRGSSCPHSHELEYTCDECGAEEDPRELYIDPLTDMMLCKKCLLGQYKTVDEVY